MIPSEDKKGITVPNAFQKTLDQSGRKPSKILVDKTSQFYNDQLNHA